MESFLVQEKLTDNTITFNNPNNDWLLKIDNNGKIEFSDKAKKENIEEFAKEFISIIEKNTSIKSHEILNIINSDEYKNTPYKRFASENDRDFIKARLFDKMCNIFK